MTDAELHAAAGRIIQIAMGREKISRGRGREAKTVWRADEDPLAYVLGVEAIVDLVNRTSRPTKGFRQGIGK